MTLSTLRHHVLPTTAPDLHLARVTRVEELDRRHSAAVSASAATSAAITLAREELAQRLERERLAKDAEDRRIESLAQWVRRRDDFDSHVRDARAAAALLADEAAAETRKIEAWRTQAKDERIVLLGSEELDGSSGTPDGPLQHARTVPTRLAEQVRALDALSPALAASEASLAQSLTEFRSDEHLEASNIAAAVLRAELEQAREQIEQLASALSQAASDADMWPGVRDRELEIRRVREEERCQAEARRRGAELDARLVEVQKTLDGFDAVLERLELLSPSLSHSKTSPFAADRRRC